MEERCPNLDLCSPKNGPVEISVPLGTSGVDGSGSGSCMRVPSLIRCDLRVRASVLYLLGGPGCALMIPGLGS